VTPKIRVLPRELAEKIAAGEVIERPFSVVKELVENSLDAGSHMIQVELEEGGHRAIRVVDDGTGIPADDMPLALERHATSKITALDDLWNLHTMGFRGEALPSVAAISHFTLESRMAGHPGRTLAYEGGRLVSDKTLAANALVPLPSGTRVSVEHLFFNVPARLKFLKSKASESGAVRDLLERIALCWPGISFTLLSDNRKTLYLPSTPTPEVRFAEVVDAPVEDIEAYESHYNGITVKGWIDRNGRASNSRQIFLAVNGRMLRDKLLQQACMVAMRPAMMEGEFPRLFLNVEISPQEIDVNVHPTKSEVRFQRSRDVFGLIHSALGRISRTPTQPFYSADLGKPSTKQQEAPLQETPLIDPGFTQRPLFQENQTKFRTKTTSTETYSSPVETTPLPLAESTKIIESPSMGRFSKLHYIGQVKNTYLLFQDGDGLVIIDQHAAHERVNYEKIKDRFVNDGLKPQPLLLSATYKCKPEDVALALDQQEFLIKLGFEVEAFGDNHLIIRSSPEGLGADKVLETFHAIMETLRDSDDDLEAATKDPSRLSPKLERTLSTAACHSSIRAGQPLAPREAQALVDQMETTASSLNCPHGRPASVKLTFSQLESLFKRI